MDNYYSNYIYKIILVGDAAVGKTHILNRFIKNEYPKIQSATIGVEFATKTLTLQEGSKIKLEL